MGTRAAVIHVRAAVFVLRHPDRRIRYRAVWRLELRERHARDISPESLRHFKVETPMQIDAGAEPRFVDSEESSQPRAEKTHHLRVGVCKQHLAIRLRPLTRV